MCSAQKILNLFKMGMNDRSRDFQFAEAAPNRVMTMIHETCHPDIRICFLDAASSWCLRLQGL